MRYIILITFLVMGIPFDIYADNILGENIRTWLDWFGKYHFIFVHFPIALILMAGFSELLFFWTKESQYIFLVNFLLISSAVFVIPTILSGLSLEESGFIDETPLLVWHKIFGVLTFIFTFITIALRYYKKDSFLYFLSFFLLLSFVLIASHFGGLMAFGSFNLLPPIFH